MKPDYLARNDVLLIKLYGATDPLTPDVQALRKIVQMLEEHGFGPDTIPSGKTEKSFSIEAVLKAAGSRRETGGVSVSFLRNAEIPTEMSFFFLAAPRPVQFTFDATTPLSSAEDPARARAVASLLRELAGMTKPLYGLAHSRADFHMGTDPYVSSPLGPPQVYEPYWLSLYGSAMVDAIGRDRVLSTPATRVDRLPDGSVMLQVGESPSRYASHEARRQQALAMAHLRGVKMEEELSRLQSRSDRLAPVEKHWHPDVVDLFERVVDHAGFPDRQMETERLNRLGADEVSEWRPITALLPANVDDPGKAIDRYATFSEQLVALLYKDVPNVSRIDPNSLPLIDFHFWLHDYPTHADRRDIESDLMPAVGGYLGQMLVDQLAGKWVPRLNRDESQVIVGDRAWLPFLRAQRYLTSRDSLLTHSLTRFFREARRTKP